MPNSHDQQTSVDELSLIRQDPEPTRVTVSARDIDGTEAIMPVASPPCRKDEDLDAVVTNRRYLAPMTSAATVIAAIDARCPGLSEAKTHLLLFFCQGHHLAHGGDPLFSEPIHATDRGVTVDDLSAEPAPALSAEGPLNTVGYVLSRYGNLSPADLRTLVQASQPWQLAAKADGEPRIEWAWLTDWFRRPDETDDADNNRPTTTQLTAWRARKAG